PAHPTKGPPRTHPPRRGSIVPRMCRSETRHNARVFACPVAARASVRSYRTAHADCPFWCAVAQARWLALQTAPLFRCPSASASLPGNVLGVEGETVEISGQELLLLVVLFVVPMELAAWLLRRS